MSNKKIQDAIEALYHVRNALLGIGEIDKAETGWKRDHRIINYCNEKLKELQE